MKNTKYITPEEAYKKMTGSSKSVAEKEAERDFLADSEGSETARLRMLNRMGINGNKSVDAESARKQMINRQNR